MTEGRRTGWEEADRWFAGGGGAGDAGTPPPATEGEPEPRCAVCGAELEADQTYCLECGSPTPLAPRLRRGGRNLAVLAGAAAILGLGAGALAYAVTNDDDGAAVTTPTSTTSTSPLVPLPPETAPTIGTLPPDTSFTVPTIPDTTFTTPTAPATGFDTVTGPAGTTAPPATTEPIDPVDPVDPGGVSDWPAGQTAWTAILSSVRDESDARAAKTRLAASGEPAGVLFSSDFADLEPGYWVVFSGSYDDRGPAIAQATALRPQFPGAYARRLEG